MDREDLATMLRSNLAEVLEVKPDEIKDDTDLADLDADSIDLIEVISTVERELQIKIEEERFYDVETFGQLVQVIDEELVRQA